METVKIKDVIAYLESLAPIAYQEPYDNAGLLTGDKDAVVKSVLVTLDCTEQVVLEAASLACNLIVAHHPILFNGIKSLTGKSYVERTVLASIRKDIAIYAVHTNLDNVSGGVSSKIGEKLGLKNMQVLCPRKSTLSKLVVFTPEESLDKVMLALYGAGAGQLGNYSHCSFQVRGTGTFTPDENARPAIGQEGQLEKVTEIRAEVVFPSHASAQILAALKHAHPYEEVAHYITPLENNNPYVGAGLVGDLPSPQEPLAYLQHIKKIMQASVIRHTQLPASLIHRVAVCGGAGSSLLPEALRQHADIFISADFKYHEFFDAEGKIVIADIGHYESEQYTKELLMEVLTKNFTTFACNFSKTVTNPISYL